MLLSPSKLESLRKEYGAAAGRSSLVAAVGREMTESTGRDYMSRANYVATRTGKPGEADKPKEVSEEIGALFIAALSRVFRRDVGRGVEDSEILEDAAEGAASGRERTSNSASND